jgi:hypothetical protein
MTLLSLTAIKVGLNYFFIKLGLVFNKSKIKFVHLSHFFECKRL